MRPRTAGGVGGVALVALALILTPALAQSSKSGKKARPSTSLSSISSFTPAVGDPRLAAAFAGRGTVTSGFRFTPSSASPDKKKAVRVAVRAKAATPAAALRSSEGSGGGVTAITPTAYNLGVAVGWKRFALSGDVGIVRDSVVPGERDSAAVGVSYSPTRSLTGRIGVAAERAEGTQRLIGPDQSYSLDVGGSYSIARNIDLTGGVRYKVQHERLEPLTDERRDSQAVYIGTAFRF